MKASLWGFAVAFALCVSACAPKAQSSDSVNSFAPLLKAGSSWTNTVAANQTISQTIGGRALETKEEFSTSYRFTVTGRAKTDELSLEVSYEALSLDMRSPAGSYSFDSAKAPDPESPLAPLRGLIGGRFAFTLGSDLRLREISGLPELAAKMAAAARKPELASIARAYLNEAAIRQSLESMFGFFPASKVAVGSSWTSLTSLGAGGQGSTKSKVTVTKIAGDHISETIEGTTESAGKGAVSSFQGQSRGSIELDVASLRILGGSMSQKLTGTVAVNGTSIPVTMTSAIRYE